MGSKRSVAKVQAMETLLRDRMAAKGIAPHVQDEVCRLIEAVGHYMFPESHAASFASLTYASAYLREHYRAAFTAAILNQQPMGFYSPDTIVRDAQRHGLKVRHIDVNESSWLMYDRTIQEFGFKPSTANRTALCQKTTKGRGRNPRSGTNDQRSLWIG
jgi:error-prone DNA polymerase